MKKIFTYLLALATVTTVVSCDDKDDPEPIIDPIEPVAGPTITWASNPNFDEMEIKEEMDVKIQVDAPAGIKTFKIAVKSEVLKDMGITAIDLIEPGENVKQYVDMILGGAGNPMDKTSYSLDLSKLVPMINNLTYKESDHTFTLTVADKNDSTAMQTVVFHRVAKDFTVTVLGVEFEMVYVKGGTFMMGATQEQGEDAENDEKPVHSVTLSDYYIGKFEVTQDLWEKVMNTTLEEQGEKEGRYYIRGQGSNYPMYYVNWNEAKDFCEKLSEKTGKKYVLPTEAQWEYAARGGTKSNKYKYSGNNMIDNVAWYTENSVVDGTKCSHPVGTKDPNELGIYDMSGNVYEWCNDYWNNQYNGSSQTDPTGPESASFRVIRSGAWSTAAKSCRVSFRGCFSPNIRDYNLGFRVALVP